MATEAQFNANRKNSRKSKGPKTEAGKNVARFNALRHGLTGHIFALIPADIMAFAQHEKGFMESLKPVGHAEKNLVTQIARDHWRINGHSANEQNMIAWVHDNQFVDHTHECPSPEVQAAAIRARICLEIDFSPIPLYQGRIQRMIKENMRELRQMQAERLAAEASAKADETALLEEAKLLLRLAGMDAETLDVKILAPEIGSVFSNPALRARLNRDLNLERARHYAKNGWNKAKTFAFEGLIIPQAA